jgi:aryl-alcohol dehydrogenase-like predicted oxidoreductase
MTDTVSQATAVHRIPAEHVIGVGAWAWGDSLVWGFGKGYDERDVNDAFSATLDAGVTFVDTAELYGFGKSERLIGKFLKENNRRVYVATKFFPLPHRLLKGQLIAALKGSLRRLQMDAVDLYQIHWHMPPMPVEHWAEALADALDRGLIRAAGVSNYNRDQTARAHETLLRRGCTLASNQVEYSLLNRRIERNGVKQACAERGITVIAYSPIAMGLLTGKYSVEKPPPGMRGGQWRWVLPKLPPLIDLLNQIGENHGGKSPAQVAINWTMCKGTLPIPGAKNRRQAEANAGAVGWRLTPDEVAALDEMSERVTRG